MSDGRRLGWALMLVLAPHFVLQLDFSIVNVGLPTIQRELGFAPADLQWIVTSYAMTGVPRLPKGTGELHCALADASAARANHTRSDRSMTGSERIDPRRPQCRRPQ